MSDYGENRFCVKPGQLQQGPLKLVNLAGCMKQFPSQYHPIKSDIDVITTSSYAQVAGDIGTAKTRKPALEVKEKIFLHSAIGIALHPPLFIRDSPESSKQNRSVPPSDNAAGRQHYGMGLIDFHQGLEEVSDRVLEVRLEYGFQIGWMRKC
jgi:hypothetical protein